MPDQATRKYRISDVDMITSAKNKRAFFLQDLADFTDADGSYTSTIATTWNTKITAAEATSTDEVINDQLTQLTANVELKMKDCRSKYQTMKHFIEKAFPNNEPVWNEFGYNNYRDASQSQVKLISFMSNLARTATKYATQLINANYTQLMIDDITTVKDALDAANITQDTFDQSIPTITQDRIKKMNAVWAQEVDVCTFGKSNVYPDDYAKFQRYLLPPGEEDPLNFSISGFITFGGVPLIDAEISIQGTLFNAISDSNGLYGIGIISPGTYTIVVTKAGYVTQTISNVAVASGTTTPLDIVMVAV